MGRRPISPPTCRRILYEKYRNEIASKIRVTHTAGDAASRRVNVRRDEWA